jgi:hypothetical protein
MFIQGGQKHNTDHLPFRVGTPDIYDNNLKPTNKGLALFHTNTGTQ